MKETFMYENQLQSLPVPALGDTCEKLLRWIQPIVDETQYEVTKEAVDQFLAENGPGEILQKQLENWDEAQTGSWLKPLWDDLYLTHRDSLPVTMNFNVLLESISNGEQIDFAEVIAKIGILTAQFYHDIIDGKIAPEMMRQLPLDMGQFRNFFRSARIPHRGRDTFYVAPFTKEENFIIVLYKNNVLQVPITNEAGEIYDMTSIVTHTKETMNNAQEAENIGLFTVANRDEAANVRTLLAQSKKNEATLQAISEALLIVSIDEKSTDAISALHHLMLGTDNKFFDKTVQIILTKHGEIGFNMEHTAIDGTSIATFIQYVSEHLRLPFVQESNTYLQEKVHILHWETDENIQKRLHEVARYYTPLKENIAMLFHQVSHIGANNVKQLKLSPDAFFHMALQLAYYRTYGTLNSVYEPVAVRTFKDGRTECARATSAEKSHVVHAIEGGRHSADEIYSLMQVASDAHSERLRTCQQGLGVERHMFGLEKMFEEFGPSLGMTEKPSIFVDQGYRKLRHDSLSTSGMNYANAIARMFAPTVKDGHGIAYIMGAESITISISSFKHNEKEGAQLLDHFLQAIDELIESATEAVQ